MVNVNEPSRPTHVQCRFARIADQNLAVHRCDGDPPAADSKRLARQTIYRLHQNLNIPVIFAAFEATDQPASGATVHGINQVTGWAFADGATVTKVEILVDSSTDGQASYGKPRPDVQAVMPDSPINVGFSFSLDTTKYPNGLHRIYVRVTDSSGNIAVSPSVPATFAN